MSQNSRKYATVQLRPQNRQTKYAIARNYEMDNLDEGAHFWNLVSSS